MPLYAALSGVVGSCEVTLFFFGNVKPAHTTLALHIAVGRGTGIESHRLPCMLRRRVKTTITADLARALLAKLGDAPRSFILQDKYRSWPPLPERTRERPGENDGDALSLSRSVLAQALASPVRMCKVTRQRLPSAFLRAFRVSEGKFEPARDNLGGRRLYLLDSERVVRHATRTLLPRQTDTARRLDPAHGPARTATADGPRSDAT